MSDYSGSTVVSISFEALPIALTVPIMSEKLLISGSSDNMVDSGIPHTPWNERLLEESVSVVTVRVSTV
jgi:hypothetical protein